MEHAATILLVDDDIELLKALTKILEREGYKVTAYHTADAAMRAINKTHEQFDLCITDESMPGMRGIAFLTLLKQAFPQTPVIIMTAFGDWGQYVTAMRAGAFEFLTKPVNKTDLLTVVDRALKPPSLRQSA